MIENKDMPSFPVLELQHRGDKLMLDLTSPGLTKREYFAAMAMQGLLSNPDYNCPSRPKNMVTVSNTALCAISYADALLNELSKS